MSEGRRAFLLALAAYAVPAIAAAQATPRLERLAIVSGIWLEARQNFVDWERVRADWDSAYHATMEAVERGGSDVAFFRALRRFTALLQSGDVAVVPPSNVARQIGRPPIRLQSVDGRPLVVQVQPTAETRIAGVVPGDEIVEVQGIPVVRWLRDSVLPETPASSNAARLTLAVEELLTGRRGTAVQLTLHSADGTPRGASLTRSVAWETRIVPAELRDGFAARDSAGVRIITLGQIDDDGVVEEFGDALTRAPLPTGLILDLRGATGGGHARAMQLATHVVGVVTEAPRMKHRIYWPVRAGSDTSDVWTWHMTAPDTIRPATRPFAGPIVVLASSRTSGAAELLAAVLRAAERATVVGEMTAGAPGLTSTLSLPHRWLLEVPSSIPVAADASEMAVGGLEPDHRVRPSRDDIRGGRDAALARALELLDVAAQEGGAEAHPSG